MIFMKALIVTFFFLGIFSYSNAQIQDMYITSRAVDVSLFDKIDGSPYLDEEPMQSYIRLKTGEQFNNVWIRFNIYNNEILLEQKGDQILALQNIDSVAFSRKSKEGEFVKFVILKTGFPAIGTYNEQSFYEILYSGKDICFLKYYKTTIEKIKKMGMPDKDAFITTKEYYIYKPSSRTMTKVKLNKKNITEVLEGYPNFKETKNTAADFKTEQSIINLLDNIRL
jgi:hypothetical protein